MRYSLLATEGVTFAIVAAIAVAALFLMLYGVFRRFTRMGWWGIQIALIFSATLLFDYIPMPEDPVWAFVLSAVGLLLVSGLVLGASALLRPNPREEQKRKALEKRAKRTGKKIKRKKVNPFLRALDSIFGGLNAVVNFCVLVLVLGGAVVVGVSLSPVGAEAFAGVSELGVWQFLQSHALDMLLVGLLVGAIKGGYRVGFLRSVWTVLILLLGVGSLVGSIFAAIYLPFLSNFSQTLATAFAGGMDGVLATVLGYGIVSLICFVVCISVLLLLNLLINLCVRKVENSGVVRVIDGTLIAIVFFAVTLALACGVGFLCNQMVTGAFGAQIQEGVTVGFPLEQFLTSSPLAKILYESNPFLLFV